MKTVIGAFDTFAEARAAVDALERAGFNENDVSVVANNNATATTADTPTPAATDRPSVGGETVTGAVVGGLTGLIIAGLAPIVLPGIGAVATAGWLTMALTGAAIGAGVGLVGALMGVGVPEEHAHYYNETVRRGGTLVLVRSDDARANEAARILSDSGAIDIDERAATYRQEGWTPGSPMAAPLNNERLNTPTYAANTTSGLSPVGAPATAALNTEGETRIPVIEEQLQVGKQRMEQGGVRVYTHMTQQPVQEQVNLREEHVNVERRPVDRPVSSADINNMQDRTIEVRETTEVPIIQKQARVVEEVVINKDVTERPQTIADTVRRTDVEVENLPGMNRTTGTVGTMAANTATTGNVDTRGPLEKSEDFVTGDNVDDKTGRPVSADTRPLGEKVADAVTGDRVDD